MEEKKPNETVDEGQLDPNDFKKDEEGSANETNDDDKSKSEDNTNPSNQTNDSGKSTEDLEKEKEEQEKAKNARFAEERRKREAEEKAQREENERKAREKKIREEAMLEAKLGMVKKNPYTEEPIKDEEDLKIYEIQKQLEDEGKDPIGDLPKRLAEINRKQVADLKRQQDANAKRQEKIDKDIQELRAKYPNVNTNELTKDPLFVECMTGRAGRWSQVEIYEYYLYKKGIADAEKKKQEIDSKANSGADKLTSMPSSNAQGSQTQKSVADMTDEEFNEFYNKKYGGH